MQDDNALLNAISHSHILNRQLKDNLLSFFASLNDSQKEGISQALLSEKQMVLHFLKDLKDKEVIGFEEVKTNIETIQRKKRVLQERLENSTTTEELDTLLNSL